MTPRRLCAAVLFSGALLSSARAQWESYPETEEELEKLAAASAAAAGLELAPAPPPKPADAAGASPADAPMASGEGGAAGGGGGADEEDEEDEGRAGEQAVGGAGTKDGAPVSASPGRTAEQLAEERAAIDERLAEVREKLRQVEAAEQALKGGDTRPDS